MSTREKSLLTKRLSNQFREATKEPHPMLKFAMDESDITTWYVLIHNIEGLDKEYMGGEYIVKFMIPSGYPTKPPRFRVLTPNGVYGADEKVCVSQGEYHENQYVQTLKIPGFASALAGGLINHKDLGHGINIVTTTTEDRRRLALSSKEYNAKHHPEIVEMIESQYAIYSSKW